MPAAEQLLERSLEVLVYFGECLLEFLSRNLIDLTNCRRRVLNGCDEIFSLRLKELVPLGRFLVFLQRHHVDRTHGVEFRPPFPIKMTFRCQLLLATLCHRSYG